MQVTLGAIVACALVSLVSAATPALARDTTPAPDSADSPTAADSANSANTPTSPDSPDTTATPASPTSLTTPAAATPNDWFYNLDIEALDNDLAARAPVIRDVEVIGARDEAAAIERLSQITPGTRVSPALFARTARRIFARGNLSAVDIRSRRNPDGTVTVFIEVTPLPTITEIEIIGVTLFSRNEVLRQLELAPGEPLRLRRADSSIRRFKNEYDRRGYINAEIRLTFDDRQGPMGKLVVTVVEGEPLRIDRLRFTGKLGAPRSLLRAALGVRPGDIVNMEDLELGIDRVLALLRSQHYLEARVPPRPIIKYLDEARTRADIRIDIAAGPKVTVTWQGPEAMPVKTLAEWARLDQIADYSDAGVADIAERLREALLDRGYSLARVTAKTRTSPDKSRRDVLFTVREGIQTRVESIRFVGPTGVGEERLHTVYRDLVRQATLDDGLYASGALQPMVPDIDHRTATNEYAKQNEQRRVTENDPTRLYRARHFERACEALAGQYRRWGYLSASARLTQIRHRDEGRLVALTITVDAGVQTQIIEARVERPRAILPDFETALKVSSGTPYDEVLVESQRAAIERQLHDEGYLYAQVFVRTDFSPDKRTVRLTWESDEGVQVKVGEIRFRGLIDTKPLVIEESLMFKRGGVFRRAEVEATRRLLLNTGILSSVSINVVDLELVEDTKDVVIEVRERARNVIEPGFGLSTTDGVRAFVEYRHFNLFGSAVDLLARARVNYRVFDILIDPAARNRLLDLPVYQQIERLIELGFHYPRIFGWSKPYKIPHNVGARVDLVNERDNGRTFGLDRFAIAPGIDIEIIRKLTATVQYEIEYANLTVFPNDQINLTPDEQDILRLPEGQSIIGTLRNTWTYDLRDNAVNPRRGALFTATADWAQEFGGDIEVRYVKLHGRINGYLPLSFIGDKWVLAGAVSGGNIFSFSNSNSILEDRLQTPLNRRFYLGGRATLRGFPENGLSPTYAQRSIESIRAAQASDETVQSLGGNTFLLFKGELRFPIVGDLGGAVFMDWGGLWLTAADFNWRDLRPASGFGIRYATPVGPLAVDLGFNINPNRAFREAPFAIHFAIGAF